MPVISRIKSWHDGAEYTRVLKVDSHGQFSMELPPSAAAKLGYRNVTGTTRKECERNFEAALEEYDKLQTVTTKVILYEVKTKARISRMGVPHRVPGAEPSMHCVFQQDQVSFANGLTLSITAGVFEKTTIKGTKGGDRFEFKEMESKIPDSGTIGVRGHEYDNLTEMAWSQEREDFFARIILGMEELILMLTKLQTEELALQIADSGVKLLGQGDMTVMLPPPPLCDCPRPEGQKIRSTDSPYCPKCGRMQK